MVDLIEEKLSRVGDAHITGAVGSGITQSLAPLFRGDMCGGALPKICSKRLSVARDPVIRESGWPSVHRDKICETHCTTDFFKITMLHVSRLE